MGVYLPNMEMPKGCAFCRIGKRNGKKMVCPLCDEEWDIHDPISADHRLDNCPLVPVPPHGRLGDLDELKERATKRLYASNNGSMAEAYYASIIDLIDSAPTIIPADPAEEGE